MKRCLLLTSSVLIALIIGLPASAQSVISARSGLIHYVEGRVLLGDKAVETKIGNYPEIKENMQLRTEDGRAEVLLNPGVFLRVAENSAVRMVASKLSDTRVEFVSGSVLIESDSELAQKENSVTISYKDSVVHLRKSGIYRFDSEPAQFKAYSGEADVEANGNLLVVKSGKMVAFDGAVSVEKFDPKAGDSLSRWSKRRAEYISMANVSAAKYVKDSGRSWQNGWFYNPYFGMFTFIPGGGYFSSPYGYRYYSPGAVYRVYEVPVIHANSASSSYNSALGYSTAPRTSSGYSGVMAGAGVSAAAPTTAASGASAAPVARSGSGGGRGR